jgi:formylglycine-generating enzyme required for sulfatase activity
MRRCFLALVLLLSLPALLVAADGPEAILPRFVDEFVTLTPGTGRFPAQFVMGSKSEDALAAEKPSRAVQMAYPFAIAKYEVTQELYEKVMGKNPSRWKGPRNSVEMVNWDEANEFCRRVTVELRKLKLLADGEVIRLPTEAEWEYACRAGTETRYSFGDKADELKDHAWFNGNAKGEDPPVGKKKPNAWDLYDLHGYVWEWCLDSWHPSYEGAAADSRARQDAAAKERVIRGGSWADAADAARSAYRGHQPPDRRSDAIGFRCVRVKEKGASQ